MTELWQIPPLEDLTDDELSALSYVSGYVQGENENRDTTCPEKKAVTDGAEFFCSRATHEGRHFALAHGAPFGASTPAVVVAAWPGTEAPQIADLGGAR
jgi:hypothetical protein